MKERNHRSGIGVDARQIGSFVPITPVACERQACGIVGTAMLFRHNVFHMESNQGRCPLRKTAIFARVAGTGANEAASSLIRLRSPAREIAAGLCLHDGNDVGGLDKVFVFGILGGRESAFIRLAAQLPNSRFQVEVHAKIQKGRGRFRRQSLS